MVLYINQLYQLLVEGINTRSRGRQGWGEGLYTEFFLDPYATRVLIIPTLATISTQGLIDFRL